MLFTHMARTEREHPCYEMWNQTLKSQSRKIDSTPFIFGHGECSCWWMKTTSAILLDAEEPQGRWGILIVTTYFQVVARRKVFVFRSIWWLLPCPQQLWDASGVGGQSTGHQVIIVGIGRGRKVATMDPNNFHPSSFLIDAISGILLSLRLRLLCQPKKLPKAEFHSMSGEERDFGIVPEENGQNTVKVRK